MEKKAGIEDFITTLIREGGSDLHLAAGRKPAIRVSGDLLFLVNQDEISSDQMVDFLNTLLGNDRYESFLKKKEFDFSYSFNGSRLRGNAFFQRGLACLSLRLIPKSKPISELHLPTILENFSRRKQGFFLVVGPVGQGKSTTLSSMVDLINQERTAHIVTIEDPIEFIYEPNKSIIDQREVGIDTDDFPVALKAALREDVNVLLIGEMRDPETISAAVTAAETGHLVFSTLHTNNASQTIDRIIDSFPQGQQDQIRIQLAASLIGIFSQRLIPRIAGGRVPAYELLINNNAVSNLIRERRTHEIDIVIETSFEQGMIDMNRSLIELVQQGEISMDTAYQYSFNPKALEQLM
ncbi:MAG: PilT/PilU family type 4a pilus ATPase [Candidatus Nomurabacteria bacterium]|nr:PilT/PilU family type 4a pilus ATPase [Candidatus Nomurabacteria bacterium]